MCLSGSYMCQVSALGGPERSCADSEKNGSRDERDESWVELSRDVENVAQHAHHDRPLCRPFLNEECGEEHGRDHKGSVHGRQGVRPQSVLKVK